MEMATEADLADEQAQDVAVTSQELGSWVQRWSAPANALGRVELGTNYLVMKERGGPGIACPKVKVIENATGWEFPSSGLPCVGFTAFYSTTDQVFAGDSDSRSLYTMSTTGALSGTWTLLARTFSNGVESILADASYVYWQDNVGVHRVSRATGVRTTMYANTGTYFTLLGTDGGSVYVITYPGANKVLRKVSSALVDTVIATPNELLTEFAIDKGYIYWLRHAPNDTKIMRIPKTGSTVATTVQTTGDAFTEGLQTFSSRSLYWLEQHTDGSTQLYRKPLEKGQVSAVDVPEHSNFGFAQLAIGPSQVSLLLQGTAGAGDTKLYTGTL